MVSSAAMMAFFEESEEHLETAESSLLELEKKTSNVEALNELFRAIHSLKGNAGLVGLMDIHEVATEMESMLDRLRKGSEKAEQEDLDKLFKLLDTLQNLVEKAGLSAEDDSGKEVGDSSSNDDEIPDDSLMNKSESSEGEATSPPKEEVIELKKVEVDSSPTKPEPSQEVEKSQPSKVKTPIPAGEDKIEDEVLSFLTFSLGKETYGVDIRVVREIILSRHLTRVPNAKDYVTGVMNLRGMVIPVIDAKKRLGFGNVNENLNHDSSSSIVIVEEDSVRTGVSVDTVDDIVRFHGDMIVPSAEVLGGIDSSYIYGMGKVEAEDDDSGSKGRGKTVVLLDTKAFCGTDEQYYMGG